MPVTLNLAKDHPALIKAIKERLGDQMPVAVNLDTLNRSIGGSENSDEDMSAYIRAADAIRETFECAIPIVHHCGHEGTRPRGHSSMPGAIDAQIQVSRDPADRIVAEVELSKDGPQGAQIVSSLEIVPVGTDEDGEEITSCVVKPEEAATVAERPREPKLRPNQKTLFMMLHAAGGAGLTVEEWNEQAREAGIGVKRKADLNDIRSVLLSKRLIRNYGNKWTVNNDS
jgi:AAA domain